MKRICLITGREAPLMEKCNVVYHVDGKFLENDEICTVGCGLLKNCQEYTHEETVKLGLELYKVMKNWHEKYEKIEEMTEDELEEISQELTESLGDLAVIYGVIWKLRNKQKHVRLCEDCFDSDTLLL